MVDIDDEHLKSWIGNELKTSDTIDVKQARLIAATLDEDRTIQHGDPLPALWHWCYFLDGAKLSETGRDGHPARGGFLPPIPLPRRMWAGGRLTYFQDIPIGGEITKISTIKNVATKEGRSGKLCFVTVSHDFADKHGERLLSEEQDIVYREDPAENAPKPQPVPAPEVSDADMTATPSTLMLFRYSALTFNGHRIHYDRTYCQEVEGYPGLIFHGPLTATLLAQFASKANDKKRLKSFSFRAVSPLFDTETFPIKISTDENGNCSVWAETPEGGLAMKAEASFET